MPGQRQAQPQGGLGFYGFYGFSFVLMFFMILGFLRFENPEKS
jgi:hypothetical protein